MDTCIAGVVVGILVERGAAVPLLVDKGGTLAWELVAVDGGNSPFAAFGGPLGGLLIEPGVFGFAMVFPLFVEAPCSFLI